MANRTISTSGFPQAARVAVPNDITDNANFGPRFANMIWIGGAGNTTLVLDDGVTLLLVTALSVGEWHPMPAFTRVNATGTDATAILVGVSYE